MPLEMNEYQRISLTTAIYDDKILYPALKIAGEAGECSEKVGKWLRDKGGVANLPNISDEDKAELAKEIGDVLWYCATLAHDIGYTLDDVARMNIGKLAKRKEEGKLSGSGDNR